jgi:hypothetical protein
MKRVLFLAVFTMERERLYLLFTVVALLPLVYSLFHGRDQIRATPKVDRHSTREAVGEIAS